MLYFQHLLDDLSRVRVHLDLHIPHGAVSRGNEGINRLLATRLDQSGMVEAPNELILTQLGLDFVHKPENRGIALG